MSGFYGGRAGAPFIIVATFETETQMVEAFKQGGAYKDVAYGEHVMIQYQNHENNGKIYRRGHDYQNDWGGAEYVGQVSGPQGYIPYVDTKSETLFLLDIIRKDTTG